MVIGAISKNMFQASQFIVLFLTPILFLSGSWTPIEAMPKWIQPITQLSPLKYYMDASFGIALKGTGITYLWPDLIGLTSLGSVLFVFCAYKLGRAF